MDNAMVMKICYSREGRSNQIGRIGLVVATFSTYSVKKFSAKGEVGNKVDCEDCYPPFETLR